MKIGLRVRHNTDAAARRVSALPRRLKDAMREATPDATRALEAVTYRALVQKAGGAYWPVRSEATASGDNARGRVVVSRSKAHRIEPKKEHGLLVFEIDGRTVFVRGGVNHPGSNPPRDLVGTIDASPMNTVEEPYTQRVRSAIRGGI